MSWRNSSETPRGVGSEQPTKEHEMKIRLGASVRVMAGGRQKTGQIIACEGNCEAGYTYTIRLRNGSMIQRDRQEIER